MSIPDLNINHEPWQDFMAFLEPEDIAYFKTALARQLEELLTVAEKTVNDLVQSSEWAADPLDQAVMEADRSYTLRIRDRESHLIKKIKTALVKIEEGTFGICEVCEDEIALARLKARPVTAYCIQCKTQLEAFEKGGRAPVGSKNGNSWLVPETLDAIALAKEMEGNK
jgi:DnaK suppressor protein